MSLYPSLEDMEVGKMLQAQISQQQSTATGPSSSSTGHRMLGAGNWVDLNHDIPKAGSYPAYPGAGAPAYPGAPPPTSLGSAHSPAPSGPTAAAGYPSLEDYMGLTPEVLQAYLPFPNVAPTGTGQQNNAVVAASTSTVAMYPKSATGNTMIAPVTSLNMVGLRRAEVTHGIRQVTLCRDGKGKLGVRLFSVNNGVFVSFVMNGSPAALGGLRFGDQVLQVEGENCAGWSTDKAMEKIAKVPGHTVTFAVRDRPFERTITMQKDSNGRVGFGFKNGKIGKIVKDTSAARNGILTDHNILEVNGQNVIGMKDDEVLKIMEESPYNITVTVMPSPIFQHIIKSMSSDLVKKNMDHSVPCV